MSAFYRNWIGLGDDGSGRPLNRGALDNEVDFTLQGDPNAWSDLFADLRLDPQTGTPRIFEAWLDLSPWGAGTTLRAGFLDLTGILDASAIANDEKTQFTHPGFVDSPLLGTPSNGPAALLWLGRKEGPNLKLALQTRRGAQDPADDLFLAAEAEAPYQAWGGGAAKLWAREAGSQTGGAVPAAGLVWDQRLSASCSAFVRGAQEFSARGIEHDPINGAYAPAPLNVHGASGQAAAWTLSAGVQKDAPFSARPDDSLAAAWGTVRADDGSSFDAVEAYYKAQFGPDLLFSLHYRALRGEGNGVESAERIDDQEGALDAEGSAGLAQQLVLRATVSY